jgi:hypothetical protein
MRVLTITVSQLLLCGALLGCTQTQTDDDEMFLTGTEEYAVTKANGMKDCTNPKKVLVCHIPPGNPDNAHDICVGASAVEPHQTQHGDTLGACVPPPPPPPPPPTDGDGDPDTGGIGVVVP